MREVQLLLLPAIYSFSASPNDDAPIEGVSPHNRRHTTAACIWIDEPTKPNYLRHGQSILVMLLRGSVSPPGYRSTKSHAITAPPVTFPLSCMAWMRPYYYLFHHTLIGSYCVHYMDHIYCFPSLYIYIRASIDLLRPDSTKVRVPPLRCSFSISCLCSDPMEMQLYYYGSGLGGDGDWSHSLAELPALPLCLSPPPLLMRSVESVLRVS